MKWQEHNEKLCAIARTLGVIGEPWSLLIIRNCFLGSRRFDQLQQQLGLTRHVLALRLKTLVANDVLCKVPYSDHGGRHEYRLSEKGKALYPILLALAEWGNTYLFESKEQPSYYHHERCGQRFRPVMSCSCCGEKLAPKEVSLKPAKPLQDLALQLDETQLEQQLGYKPPQ